MRAVTAILRLELRLLRRDVLVGGALLIAVSAAAWTGALQGRGAHLDPAVRGSVLFVLVLVGIARITAVDAQWAAWRGALPIRTAQVTTARFLLWSLFAGLPAVVYPLWVASPPAHLALHVLTVWLWMVLAGTAVLQFRLFRRTAQSWFDVIRSLAVAAVVMAGLPAAVAGDRGWLDLPVAPWLLGAALLAVVVHGARSEPEWLPPQSPKDVRPRAHLAPGPRRRSARPRTPRQVLAHLGVRRFGVHVASLLLLGYVCLLAILGENRNRTDADSNGFMTPVVVLLAAGIFFGFELRQVTARWALLGAYPLTRRRVLTRPLIVLVGIGVAMFGVYAWAYGRGNPGRLAKNVRMLEHGVTGHGVIRWLPVLAVPAWAERQGVTHDRPAGMPPPAYGSWHLRESALSRDPRDDARDAPRTWSADGAEQARYFVDATRYALRLVHGVDASDEEFLWALGEPFVVASSPADVPVQHFLEHFHTYGPAPFHVPQAFSETHVHVGVDLSAVPTSGEGPPRLAMYAFAPALDRLQTRLQDRLSRAAWLRFVLDASILLLCILLFVALVLREGAMRLTLPPLAVLPVLLWFGGRATTLGRAVRDAHLAHPWIAVTVTAVLATLLILAIRRQLGRVTPAPLVNLERPTESAI